MATLSLRADFDSANKTHHFLGGLFSEQTYYTSLINKQNIHVIPVISLHKVTADDRLSQPLVLKSKDTDN